MGDMTEQDEEAWCGSERERVAAYLGRQNGLTHGEIGDWPAWHVAPYVSIWSIESVVNPGWVGWWAISGDLPGDYCSADGRRHPRLALRHFAESWKAALAQKSDGAEVIGDTGLPAHLAPVLEHRAQLLAAWADDDEFWPDEIYG